MLWTLLALAGFLPVGSPSTWATPHLLLEGKGGLLDTLSTPLEGYTEGVARLHIHRDTTAARRAFERSLTLDPDYAPAHYKLAEIALAERRDKQSLEHARRAYGLDTCNKFYLTLYARTQVVNMQLSEALESFHRLMLLDRHNPDNYRMTALLEEQSGNRATAIALLDSAEVLFGYNPLLGGMKRRMLLQDGAHERALSEALAQLERAPYAVENHLAIGNIYQHTRRDSLALKAYHRALELDSTHLETLLTLTDFHNRRKEYAAYFEILPLVFRHPKVELEDKVANFKRFTSDVRLYQRFFPQFGNLARTLILCYPKEPSVVELYADYLIASGDVEQALALYKMRLGDEPPRKAYYMMVVDMESYLEHPDSARHYLDRAIRLFPADPALRIQRGHLAALHNEGLETSVAAYNEALEVAQSDSLRSQIWGFIGDSYQRESQGDYTSTEELFEQPKPANKEWRKWLKRCYKAYDKALQLDRNNISVLNNYAYFLSLEGRDLERALEMSSRVIALVGNEPTYLDTHAWVLFHLGRLDEAKRLLQQAVSLDGQRSPALQLHYGDVLAALGEHFMAEIYWKRALENGYDPTAIERRINALKQKQQRP